MSAQNPLLKLQLALAGFFALATFAVGMIKVEKKSETNSYLVLSHDVQSGDQIQDSSFEQLELQEHFMPDEAVRADRLDEIRGAYFRRAEKKGRIVLSDLVVRPTESYHLKLANNETPVRIPLPPGLQPSDFVIGTKINVKIVRGKDASSVMTAEARGYRVISIGATTTEYFDQEWVTDANEQNYIRIAVRNDDPQRSIIESASRRIDGYEITDVYARSQS